MIVVMRGAFGFSASAGMSTCAGAGWLEIRLAVTRPSVEVDTGNSRDVPFPLRLPGLMPADPEHLALHEDPLGQGYELLRHRRDGSNLTP